MIVWIVPIAPVQTIEVVSVARVVSDRLGIVFPQNRLDRLWTLFETTGVIGTIRTIIWKPGVKENKQILSERLERGKSHFRVNCQKFGFINGGQLEYRISYSSIAVTNGVDNVNWPPYKNSKS